MKSANAHAGGSEALLTLTDARALARASQE
jgi:hypothetical protein